MDNIKVGIIQQSIGADVEANKQKLELLEKVASKQ